MHKGSGKFFFSIFLMLFSSAIIAQEVKISGGFIEDRMKLGENVHYWMSIRYLSQMEMILPDSNYNFSPFEFYSKNYYASQLKDGVILDSVVYTLQSYEIDKVQYLDLPAFLLANGDTTAIRAPKDSVLFMELVKVVSDTTKLKENLVYQEVSPQFNFPLLWIILSGLLLVAIILILIFGKRIQRAYRLRRLRKEYIAFSESLSRASQDLRQRPSGKIAESAITSWKRFMEKLEKLPYTKLTTKEILAIKDTNELTEALKNLDRAIYGKVLGEDLYRSLNSIEDFTQHRYNIARQKIQEGIDDELNKTPNEEKEIQSTRINQFDLETSRIYEELEKGGRFVIYYYTISIIVLSFRRSSKVYFLKSDEKGFKKGLKYSLISFFFGWWGLPWGLIYTPYDLYVNLKGGKNVTNQIVKRVTN